MLSRQRVFQYLGQFMFIPPLFLKLIWILADTLMVDCTPTKNMITFRDAAQLKTVWDDPFRFACTRGDCRGGGAADRCGVRITSHLINANLASLSYTL